MNSTLSDAHRATAHRATAHRVIRRGLRVSAVGLAGALVVVVLALGYTPIEARQGLAQKIFYIHVPSAWAALLAFSLAGVASALYLWLRDSRLDHFAAASAEVGLVFGAVMLTTGPIWAKPIWGAWWQWEPRLTLTLFLFFLFAGYLSLRTAIQDPAERARFSAVLGIMGMLLVPFVHLSVYLFRGIHPQPVVLKPSAPSLPWEMLRTLLLGVVAFTVVYFGLVMTRYGISRAELLEEADRAGA